MAKWNGCKPVRCDVCGDDFKVSFIDGRLKRGQWALLCHKCHFNYGTGLGVGRGQKYDLVTFNKIEG